MIEQLKTIRDGLENFTEPYLQKALTALTQLEAMVGEPYGTVTVVRKPGCADMHWFYRHPEPPYLDNAAECHAVYLAAPPAQQREVWGTTTWMEDDKIVTKYLFTDDVCVAPEKKDRPDVSRMVDRFLGWKLPDNFSPDAGISFTTYHPQQTPGSPFWPSGTNLLTAEQAKAMFEYVLDGQQARPWPAFDAECDAADQLLKLLGLEPDQCRTDGGAINMARVKSILADRAQVMRQPEWIDGVPHWTPALIAKVKQLASEIDDPPAQQARPIKSICTDCRHTDSWGLPDRPHCSRCEGGKMWEPLNASSVNPNVAQQEPPDDATIAGLESSIGILIVPPGALMLAERKEKP